MAHLLLQNAFPGGRNFSLGSLDVRLCINSVNMWFSLIMRAKIEQNVTQMKNWAWISSFSARFAVIKGLYWNFHRWNIILLVVDCWKYIFFTTESLLWSKTKPIPLISIHFEYFRIGRSGFAHILLIFCSQVRKKS